ncbi:HYR domain-containing protein, partial [Subsaxibacter sp. CAU 1640]|uniref:HYR domain-containing protein n=1 Tax=Subsaxibacter sp. CAU 1640 TaxID=2933271 RepID=UPI002003B74F
VSWTPPTASDNCSQTLTSSHSPGDTFALGTTTVTYTSTDAASNIDTCSFDITVTDNENPVISGCPVNISVANDAGNCSAAVSWTPPTASDNCSQTLTSSHSPGDTFALGTTTVTYTSTDAAGNLDTCSFDITVSDNENPVISGCPVNISVANDAGNCSAAVSWTPPTASDNCSQTLTSSHSPGDTFALGTTTVTYTSTDAAGNIDSCSFDITVTDNENPVPNVLSLPTINGECNASVSAPTATDNCSGTITATTSNPTSYSAQGTYTIVWTYTDASGNSSTQNQTIVVDDATPPVTPTLPTINGQCSATASIPSTTDACAGTLFGTTSDPLTYSTQGAHVITWNFNDGNGNSINVTQTVFINDTVDPTAICRNITIPLDNSTGTASIVASQIDNGSTDNCGTSNLNYTLSQSTFDCSDIGPNIIVLTVTDAGGNTSSCTSTVTITSPNINGGNIDGYLTNTESPADATIDEVIEVTACPDEPQNAILTLNGYNGNIIRWESTINGGLTWNTINNTTDTYTYNDILQTTILRAVIQIGSCQAYSSLFYIAVVPPDVPPTIVGPSEFDTCLGSNITVVAESSFGIIPDFNDGGQFNQANPEGWSVDGTGHMPAPGNNTNATTWIETNGPKKFQGRCFDTTDNTKFAIASGNAGGPFAPLTYLETPIFNTLGLTSAFLEFEQAYYLNAGAWCLIELSVDGGATYPITLDPGAGFDYTGPSNTGFLASVPGFTGQCRNTLGTLVDKPVSIDLQNYIGLVGLRIRFTFSGNTGSVWAIDNVRIPDAPVDEVIEWTDENGVVVTTGSTTTITPITPGVQTYGVTSLINGCRSEGDEGTEFISVNASFAYAGENVTPIAGECGQTTVQLAAYDNTLTAIQNYNNGVWNNNYVVPDLSSGDTDYPGTGENGFWSVASSPTSCGGNYSFSNVNSPNSTFTGEAGTYTLRWTVAGCESTVNVTLENCQSIDFDGTNDYVVFGNNYNRSGNFSLEAWIKPESLSGTQTILSKRNGFNIGAGYDLKLNGSTLSFNWNANGSIASPYTLTTERWYHIALVYNSGTYTLYMDGIAVNSASGSAPNTNNMNFILGAMDQAGNPPNKPINYFNGWMDEVRIWNRAITQSQIRQMMNQEIRDNGLVSGEVVPLDIAGLSWSDLDGYYRMDIGCGSLLPYAGTINGKIRNVNSAQQETAPIPYTSRVDGQLWQTDNTWTNFPVWDTPNSLGIDGTTPIDWNIVRTSHNILSGDKDIVVLGLLSDNTNKTLSVTDPGSSQNENNNGQSIRITHYLKLDGTIDLYGESQLLQDEGSVLDVTSAGKIERDQQGTSNLYNYNYWSSPVSPVNTSANNTNFTVDGILRDGTNSANPLNLQWTTNHNANGNTTPKTLSSRWIYSYRDFPQNSYSDWTLIRENGALEVGLGYTMKGSGAATAEQNYVFVGKPNNGTITNTVSPNYQTLVGNPYPSAIDANAFILDNVPGTGSGSIDGTLYFWEHYVSNVTHVLEDYEGGYSAYNLTGGVSTVIPDGISGAGSSTKTPGRYIPIGQAFFVTGTPVGGNISFHNSQRIFVRESLGNSVFLRSNGTSTVEETNNLATEIKRLRLQFSSDDGLIRPLLLGFIDNNAATDGFDYGYDALFTDEFQNDMFWLIEGDKYVIQGVGSFEETKLYPLQISMTNPGNIHISLEELENFEDNINTYIYDAVLQTYFLINHSDFTINLEQGNYENRFFVSFMDHNILSINTPEGIDSIYINYMMDAKEILIKNPNLYEIEKVELINILGQSVKKWGEEQFDITNFDIRIPLQFVSEGVYIVKVHTNNDVYEKKILFRN